jgi:hypothetical protein
LAPVPAIVEKVVDLDAIAKSARALNIEIQDGEKLVHSTTEKLSERRDRLGKLLVEARRAFGKRGDGFVDWVKHEIGLSKRTAHRYMQQAGYGTDRCQSGTEGDGDDLENESSAPESTIYGGDSFDPDHQALLLREKLMRAASKWPAQYRILLATELRNISKAIEVMK